MSTEVEEKGTRQIRSRVEQWCLVKGGVAITVRPLLPSGAPPHASWILCTQRNTCTSCSSPLYACKNIPQLHAVTFLHSCGLESRSQSLRLQQNAEYSDIYHHIKFELNQSISFWMHASIEFCWTHQEKQRFSALPTQISLQSSQDVQLELLQCYVKINPDQLKSVHTRFSILLLCALQVRSRQLKVV